MTVSPRADPAAHRRALLAMGGEVIFMPPYLFFMENH
jgi:hypothetical protein